MKSPETKPNQHARKKRHLHMRNNHLCRITTKINARPKNIHTHDIQKKKYNHKIKSFQATDPDKNAHRTERIPRTPIMTKHMNKDSHALIVANKSHHAYNVIRNETEPICSQEKAFAHASLNKHHAR